MTEEDTKLKYITPSILKEWNINNIKMEYKTPNNKFVDYALFIDNKLITIIEAKSYNYDDEFGLQQAIEYAKELNICFVYSSSGHKFIEYNLITKEKRILSLSTFPSPIDLSLMCDIYSNMQFVI